MAVLTNFVRSAVARTAAADARRVLARGFWLRTERVGALVIRSPRPWCPPPLARYLLRGLVARAEMFGDVLGTPPLCWDGRPGGIALRQPFLAGATPLRTLRTNGPLLACTVSALDQFWDAVERCWHTQGWLPDVGGRVYLPWELYDPLRTDNVVVDAAGRCRLVDPGASALFHSARSPLGRLHAALMLRSLHRVRDRLPRRRDTT